jgi:hypothetical protein
VVIQVPDLLKLITFTAAAKTSFSVVGQDFDTSARQSVQQCIPTSWAASLFTKAGALLLPSITGAPFLCKTPEFSFS